MADDIQFAEAPIRCNICVFDIPIDSIRTLLCCNGEVCTTCLSHMNTCPYCRTQINILSNDDEIESNAGGVNIHTIIIKLCFFNINDMGADDLFYRSFFMDDYKLSSIQFIRRKRRCIRLWGIKFVSIFELQDNATECIPIIIDLNNLFYSDYNILYDLKTANYMCSHTVINNTQHLLNKKNILQSVFYSLGLSGLRVYVPIYNEQIHDMAIEHLLN